ncbi:hypothetical protein PHAMO_10152 [Magnetospirillum molischianum DSM 120]|uniref:Uncharacterized protein n=1 Tax=Magnetospirillum molischianum DSM 120 TaxID=1150626 RepID=H8FMY9_MAGML|nr:hypothetical protein PHAMO_10152 [Magnetospirillum molischianum DSM 120]
MRGGNLVALGPFSLKYYTLQSVPKDIISAAFECKRIGGSSLKGFFDPLDCVPVVEAARAALRRGVQAELRDGVLYACV